MMLARTEPNEREQPTGPRRGPRQLRMQRE